MRRTLILTLCILLLMWGVPYADITSNLVAHWKFDEGSGTTATDSADSNTGTLADGTTYATGHIGPYALSCDGTNDTVTIAETSGVPAATGAYTVAFWVKGANTAGPNAGFYNETHSSGNPIVTIRGQNGVLVPFIRNNELTVLLSGVYSTSTILDNTWHHVVWADNAGAAVLYVDGSVDATDFTYTNSGTLTLESVLLCASATGGSVFDYFSGQLDDVRVYSRVLSSGDAAELYAFTGAAPSKRRAIVIE